MKIGIFTETYRPTVNGVVVSIDTFREHMILKGHQVFIFAPANKHAKNDPDYVFRFPAIHFHKDPVYPLAIPMFWSWAKEQFSLEIINQLDIIHIQHFSFMGQYGLRFAKELHIPSVYTYHTMAELYTNIVPLFGGLLKPAIRALTRNTAKHASQIVVPTPSIKRYLRQIDITKDIEIIPTGIDTKRYQRGEGESILKKWGIGPEKKILLYVGRLAVEKNIPFLLEAFQAVNKQEPSTHLLLIGSGPDEQQFRQLLTQKGLTEKVTITGFLDRDTTIKLFGMGTLFTFPSVTDTQGIVIVEAMAAGTPPVAIDRLGPGDIIKDGETGWLTSLNLKAFSGKMITALTDHKLYTQISKQAVTAAKEYDKSVTGQKMLDLYLSLVKQTKTKD